MDPMAATAVRAITSAMTRFQGNGILATNRLNTDFLPPQINSKPLVIRHSQPTVGACDDDGPVHPCYLPSVDSGTFELPPPCRITRAQLLLGGGRFLPLCRCICWPSSQMYVLVAITWEAGNILLVGRLVSSHSVAPPYVFAGSRT